MSERGSFVTEFIYCPDCLEKLKAVLVKEGKFLRGVLIEGWEGGPDVLPIIAGKVGGLAPGEESVVFQFELFTAANAPCHPVRIAVLPDRGGGLLLTIQPSGEVTISAEYEKEASDAE